VHPSTDVFTLLCLPPTSQRLKELERHGADYESALLAVVQGWEGVVYETGTPVPFGPAALRTLLESPEVRAAALEAYVDCWVDLVASGRTQEQIPFSQRLARRFLLINRRIK
jgi:hypothetical protein